LGRGHDDPSVDGAHQRHARQPRPDPARLQPRKPADPDFQLRYLAGLDSVNFEPGESWSYNNGGYVLLAEIVARVGGMPFADFLHERIFAPVGMADTMLRALDTDLLPNSATPHILQPGGG
jgi:CubicO group peptidase (beta-lactamase class C family)